MHTVNDYLTRKKKYTEKNKNGSSKIISKREILNNKFPFVPYVFPALSLSYVFSVSSYVGSYLRKYGQWLFVKKVADSGFIRLSSVYYSVC